LTESGGGLEYLELFVLARVLLPQDKQYGCIPVTPQQANKLLP
jgi:hypothetical protein